MGHANKKNYKKELQTRSVKILLLTLSDSTQWAYLDYHTDKKITAKNFFGFFSSSKYLKMFF